MGPSTQELGTLQASSMYMMIFFGYLDPQAKKQNANDRQLGAPLNLLREKQRNRRNTHDADEARRKENPRET